MNRRILSLVLLLLVVAAFACTRKESTQQTESGVSFTVYPGSRYLPEMTSLFKRAASTAMPNQPIQPQVIYDTEAPLEQVAEFYAKDAGIPKVWPDQSGDFSATKPPAFYRSGDLAKDFAAVEPLAKQLGVKADASKAVGQYRGAEIAAPGHPRVTLTRPYFDVLKSEVVDRTLIIMVRE